MTAVPEAADRLNAKSPVVTGLPVRGAILAANKDFPVRSCISSPMKS